MLYLKLFDVGYLGSQWFAFHKWCYIYGIVWNCIEGIGAFYTLFFLTFLSIDHSSYCMALLVCLLPLSVEGWKWTAHGCWYFQTFDCQFWQWFAGQWKNIYFCFQISSGTCQLFCDHCPLYKVKNIYLLQVIDLTSVSQELAYLASDADLVVLEGMVCNYAVLLICVDTLIQTSIVVQNVLIEQMVYLMIKSQE